MDDLELFSNHKERESWKACLRSWRGLHQDNIQRAMVNCIRNADNYIYIETQFFISNFGKWRSRGGTDTDSAAIGNEDSGIKNAIVEALAMRISDHIKAKTQFHVYLVIPVHPEGLLSDPVVMKQHRAALLSIKHGSNSLINRIAESLKALKRNPEDWTNYLTVLNMRSYGATVQYARDPITRDEDFSCEIGRFVVTEQIYIHSKLMIVDHAVAIIGSANINDRSLTGNGDTEIAAVIVDTECVELRDLGSPTVKVQTRKFARELREQLWKKHFGFLVNSAGPADSRYFRSTVRAERAGHPVANEIEHPPRLASTNSSFSRLSKTPWHEILQRPCSAETVSAIQLIALENARAYEEVFEQTPRNTMRDFAELHKSFTLPYPLAVSSLAAPFRIAAAQQFEMSNTPISHHPQYIGVVPAPLRPGFMTTMPPQNFRARPLQTYDRSPQIYNGGKVHDVTRAIIFLRSRVVGFFVLAPLDWGMDTTLEGDLSKASTVDIA